MESTFLYIKNFKYADMGLKDNFFGHPKPGKVYKAIKGENFYEVPLKSKSNILGIRLDLQESFHGDGKWNYDICEITEDNLDEFDISIEDLQEIEKEWREEDINEELLVNNSDNEEEKIESPEVPFKDMKSVLAMARVFRDIVESLNVIMKHEPEMVKIISEIIKFISEEYDPNSDLKYEIIEKIYQLKKIRNGNNAN